MLRRSAQAEAPLKSNASVPTRMAAKSDESRRNHETWDADAARASESCIRVVGMVENENMPA